MLRAKTSEDVIAAAIHDLADAIRLHAAAMIGEVEQEPEAETYLDGSRK